MKKVSGRAIKALILAALMVSVLCVTAFADSRTKNLNSNMTYFTITTGSGFSYWAGWKKTTVTVTNTGNKAVAVYSNLGRIGYRYDCNLMPGQSRTYTASGSGAQYSLQIQRIYNYAKNSVRVTTSAGSVW